MIHLIALFTFFSCIFADYSSLMLGEYEYIPIVHFDKQPIVEGRLNGKKAYFMLDSGSALSLLNSAAAPAYGFSVSTYTSNPANLNGLAGEGQQTRYLKQYEVMLGSQQLAGGFFAYPLQDLFSASSDFTPVGIIGSGLLKAYGCSIDFNKKVLRIKKQTH